MIISLTVGMKIYCFFTAHSLERDPVMMEKSTRFSMLCRSRILCAKKFYYVSITNTHMYVPVSRTERDQPPPKLLQIKSCAHIVNVHITTHSVVLRAYCTFRRAVISTGVMKSTEVQTLGELRMGRAIISFTRGLPLVAIGESDTG